MNTRVLLVVSITFVALLFLVQFSLAQFSITQGFSNGYPLTYTKGTTGNTLSVTIAIGSGTGQSFVGLLQILDKNGVALYNQEKQVTNLKLGETLNYVVNLNDPGPLVVEHLILSTDRKQVLSKKIETAISLSGSSDASQMRSEGPKSVTKTVKVGQDLDSVFGSVLDKTDLGGLRDIRVLIKTNFAGVKSGIYHIHEELRLDGISVKLPADTSESGEEIFLRVPPSSVGFYYVFDNPLNRENFVTEASPEYPFKFRFFKKFFRITSATKNSISTDVGERYDLKSGQTITASDGTKVTFEKAISSTTAQITVNGQTNNIDENSVKNIGGTEIKIHDLADDEGIEFDSATVIVGTDATNGEASNVFNDGDAFIYPCSLIHDLHNGLFFSAIGKSFSISGKTISLTKVNSNLQAEFNFDGESVTLLKRIVKKVGNFELELLDARTETQKNTAIVRFRTFRADCSIENPEWVWVLKNLDSANPTIGIRFDDSLDSPEYSGLFEPFELPRELGFPQRNINITIVDFNSQESAAKVKIAAP